MSDMGFGFSLRSALQGYCSSTTIFRRGPTMSTATGPEASDQDGSQPEQDGSQPEPRDGDVEKPEGRKKAVAGVEIGMMPEGQGSTFEPEEDREPQG
jgi:hypothetical protein